VVRVRAAAEIRLGQPVALDHGAHRTVEDEDAAGEGVSQALAVSTTGP
jgi:hypothetical protein